VVQVEELPIARGWREKLVTFTFRHARLELSRITQRTTAAVRSRRCEISRSAEQ